MNHHATNNKLGFALGLVSGGWRQYAISGSVLLMSIPHEGNAVDLVKSGMTAMVCGGAGVLGKVLVTQAYKKCRRLQRQRH